MLENAISLFKYFPEFNAGLAAGLLIFIRFLGFVVTAPIFSRKDIPFFVKISFTLIMTVVFVGILSPKAPPQDSSLILSLVLNFAFGALIGFIANCIFLTISSAGDMINLQMGLSSAVMFDQSTAQQSSLLSKFFLLFGTILFINIGGFYWLISAFERTFSVFPLYDTVIPLEKVLNIDYLVLITGNVLFVGLQIAGPVLLATLGMDIILGIISKTAPQVNVFQLSFLFKPILGVAILILIMPLLINVITDYFVYFSQIY